MKKAKQDMAAMAVLMAFSASFYFWFIPAQIRVVANSKTSFTSRTFPSLLMAALFLAALVGFINAVLTYRRLRGAEKAPAKAPLSKKTAWEFAAPFAAFGLILLYAVAFKYVGFLIPTLVFIPALLALLRCKNWKYYAGAYAFCFLIYLVFIFILHVPLP